MTSCRDFAARLEAEPSRFSRPSNLQTRSRTGEQVFQLPRTVYYIWVRLASLVLLLLSIVLAGCYSNSKPSSIGHPAPDFTIQDSDRSVTLSQLRGKIV